MALVAKMQAQQVVGTAGQRYEACGEDDEGAMRAEDAQGLDSYYGRPPWLANATHVRLTKLGQSSESFTLTAVSAKDDVDDPNRSWAVATPSGELKMSVNNPEAWGYIVPGAEYRVTIERIRGPRSTKAAGLTVDPAEVVGSFGVHDGSGNSVG